MWCCILCCLGQHMYLRCNPWSNLANLCPLSLTVPLPPSPPPHTHHQVEEGHDYCVITPPAALKPNVAIDTYDDHRMAMAFSLAACGGVPVVINDPGCTRKTFPTYFQVFEGVVTHE